ncbi:DNA polymerase beta domain protein region [Spirochaeta thermophila DSM 6578]|uniref:DNA polymerase beta domain protein region n=1 Tax=Winmispira thermophila (strain ATCC 700085 / DSM 6578 / Z-1203) TaxID=869211 RepID=G0GEA1_WINT7|nr:nucleotidyltransferase [Spirochaeta thermophila]AEJ61454.1 DNA polymerase beta domain protein region [Spirochaeta thermophila DSM 6578]
MRLKIDIPEAEIAAFCRRYRVRRLSLFGSVVRGNFGPESDVDVLVEFEPEARMGFLTLSRMARELSAILGRPVDLVPRSGLKPAIRDAILREEQVIYAS